MPTRLLSLAIAFVLAASLTAAPLPVRTSSAGRAPVVDLHGSVDRPRPGDGQPRVLVSQKALDELARSWDIRDVPKVDFCEYLLLVGTTFGQRLEMHTKLRADGTLEVTSQRPGRGAVRPGFRYQILAVPRAGVRTVWGRPVPAQ